MSFCTLLKRRKSKVDSNISQNGTEVVLASSQLANPSSQQNQMSLIKYTAGLLTSKYTGIIPFSCYFPNSLYSAGFKGFSLTLTQLALI